MQRISWIAICFSALLAGSASSVETSQPGTLSGIETQYMSPTVTAGQDFYEFVNEGWLKKTQIPGDQSNWGSFSVLDDEAKQAIRTLIEEASAEQAPQGSDSQKVGDFFKSVINVEVRNQLGTKPIQPLLDEIDSIKNKKQLAQVAAHLFQIGIAGPFAGYVSPDAKQSDQYTVYVTQSGLTLPDRDYYLEDNPLFTQARADFEVYIVDMLKIIDHPKSQLAAKQIIKLETAIATAQWDRVRNRDPEATYNKMTRDELIAALSAFDMPTFLETAGLASQTEFVVRQPDYLKAVDAMFGLATLQMWKDFYRFHVIDAFASDLTEATELRHFQFHQTALSGVEEQKPLWRRGVEASNQILGEIVGKLYVEKHFPPVAKQRMGELVENLKKAFAKRIDGLEWMSPVTKKQAHEKLSKFTTKIGYPDKWKDYSQLTIRADDLVGNYMRAAAVEYKRELDKLGGPIDRNEWHMTPQTVNAYYNPVMNEIVFPAAILQPPFFNLKADDAVNYGGIGAVIGHEISHGFDDKGSQYDGDGNIRKWWSETDRTEFERRAKQLVDQYNQYKPFDDMRVNGEFTLGENIGDLGGLSVAYEAYRMSLDGQKAPVIDGFSGDQRFFIGWAQVWRRLYREPELRKRLVQDPHSPSQYRCNGIVSNMDAFYRAFDVKPGDPMFIAPENRVRIW